MSARTLYGVSGSRALRSIWAIEEVGVDYEHIPTHFSEGSKTPDYLAINPNGRIPALVDGGGVDGKVVLFESMAINLYLAKAYGGALYPDNPADEARAIQWSVWAISEIEPLQLQVLMQKFMVAEADRDQAIIDSAVDQLQRPLTVLNDALAQHSYLLGNQFTITDLNVASVMLLLKMAGQDYSAHSNVQRWADACYARPSLAAAQARA